MKSNRKSIACLALVGVIALMLCSHDIVLARGPPTYEGKAVIKFSGSSTLHDFRGTVESQAFSIRFASGDADSVQTWSAETDVIVKEMTTANKARDKKMWEMFEAEKFPRIHGVVLDAAVPADGTATVTMRLKIRDQEKPVAVTISNWKRTRETFSFHAEWEVSLKDYGLTAPTVLGLIRVADKVRLETDVTASAIPAAAAQK